MLAPVLALCIRYKTLHASGQPLTFKTLLGLAAPQRSNMWAEELAATADAERDEEPPKSLTTSLQYPAVEERLRSWYFEQVHACLFSLTVELWYVQERGTHCCKSKVLS